MSPTLFLSYGRADAADLAERLHDSLTEAGFRVWQDRRRIRTGSRWDESIEEGLRGSQVLISLLTPHAVRRARDGHPSGVDSVCLDEIAYARGACRIPIVPIRVLPCATPLLIYRLQAVDMTAWRDSHHRYDAAFAQLTEYLRDVLAGGTRQRTWSRDLTGWDFGPFLVEKRRGFTGREWLFQAIDAWRRRPRGGALLITGDPGIGKSAIVAELVATNPDDQVLAYHCCQADTPATLDPGQFVRSMAAMLAARLPAYAEILNQPATLELLDAPRLAADPASAFEGAILGPLHQLPAPESAVDGCAYLLVDALDEALTRQAPTILDVLASRLQRLPSWLRVVATTRNDRRVVQRLSGLPTETVRAADVRNADDVRRYIEAQLAAPALQRALQSSGLAPGRAADGLVAASDGNFLFASRAIEAIERGQLTFAELGSLPPGLGNLYHLFFSRVVPVRDGDDAALRTLFRVLVSTREPLTRTQLGEITGIDAEDELPALLSQVSAFVPHVDGRYALFHRSLFEWLTGWDSALDVPVAGPYYASPRKGQTLLVAWGWGRYQRGIDTLGPYAVRHLPAHLTTLGRVDDLVALLTDWRFLEAKVEGTGGSRTSVFDLVNDFTAALEVIPHDHARRTVLELLREAVRFDAGLIARHPQALFQCCWNRCWWYDAPAAAQFFEGGSEDPPSADAPWRRSGETLHLLMEGWRSDKERRGRPFVWLRSLRPPADPIGGPQRAVLQAHLKGRITLALSSDETRLVSGSEWGGLRLWDLRSGATIAVFDRDGSVAGVAFLPGTDRLIAAYSHALLFLHADTLALEDELQVPGAHIGAFAVSPDRRWLALGQYDGTIRLIDANQRIERRCWGGHREEVTSVAFLSDEVLVSGSGDETVCLWKQEEGQWREHRRFNTGSAIEAVACAPDGGLLAWTDGKGIVTCADPVHEAQWSVQVPASSSLSAGCLAFSPDGARVFVGTGSVFSEGEAEVCILDLATRDVVRRLRGHSSLVLAIVVSRDGRSVISSGHDSTIRLWSLDRRHETPELPWWERQIPEIAFSPDGQWIYTAPAQGTFIFVRELTSGALVGMLSDLTGGVHKIAPSPDGERVAVIDREGHLRVIWTHEERPETSCVTSATNARDLRFSPDSRLAGIVAHDERLCVVDAMTGEIRVDIQLGQTTASLEIVFFSGDSRLVAGMSSKAVIVAETASGRVVARHRAPDLLYGSACSFTDGDRAIVFEGARHVTAAIEVESGRPLDVTQDHRDALKHAGADAVSSYGWGIGGSEHTNGVPESALSMEMVLGEKQSGEPVAWIPLPWAHATWTHPSGRIWALQRYAQLHVVQLEKHPLR